jgi:L-lactate dehydrogenase complex protein LldF
MAAASWVMASPARYGAAQRAGRLGRLASRGGKIRRLPPPLSGWTAARDLPAPPAQTFREWWRREHGDSPREHGDSPPEHGDSPREHRDSP